MNDSAWTKEYTRIQREIQRLEQSIKDAPEGVLRCNKNGTGYKYFQVVKEGNVQRRVYLDRRHGQLAEKLALKTYNLWKLKDALAERRALEAYRKLYRGGVADQLLTEAEGICRLLPSETKDIKKQLLEWQNMDYERNRAHSEYLKYRTGKGDLVRSKSEAFIATELYKNGIPYRYECACRFHEITIYPDFMIRHPETGSVFLWEHFGMADQSAYIKNATAKLQIYMQHGFIPTVNLITTYESRNRPLDFTYVTKLIEYHFLS